MSSKNSSINVKYSDFGGIDTRESHSNTKNIYDICNFRIDEDGSLVKRNGYSAVFTAPYDVRAVWSGMLCGEFCSFVVAGNRVYSLDIQAKTASYISDISSSEGKVYFFLHNGILYLVDTLSFYSVTRDAILPAVGYIPLYGENWTNKTAGEVLETPNVLNSCLVKITYVIEYAYTNLLPTYRPARVHSLYLNGVLLTPEQYTYSEPHSAIRVPSLMDGDTAVAYVYLENTDNDRSNLLSLGGAVSFGGINSTRLFAWGQEKPNVIYICSDVTPEQLERSNTDFPNCTPLYFPEGNKFIVGDGRYNIKSIVRHYGRMLIFTDGDVWMTDTEVTGEDVLPAMTINSTAGCAGCPDVLKIGNDPISIGKRDIFRFTANTDQFDECNAYSISDPIRKRLSPEFFKDAIAYADEYRGELWFHNPNVSSSVWIYNIKKKAWSRFFGFHASCFFDANGEVGFAYGDTVYVFDDANFYDTEKNGTQVNISASFTAHNLSFDTDREKRLTEAVVSYEGDGGSISVALTSDREESITARFFGDSGHNIESRRLHSSRFSFIRSLDVNVSDSARQTIHSIEIKAR